MEVEDPDGEAASELATARSLHDWARKLPQPARDKELPAARKRLELAEGEDKKRKPPAERLQSALSRVDHRQRQAQAAHEALKEARQAIGALEAECAHQDALLAKDHEELQVAQSLHQAWGPQARDGEGVSAQHQSQDRAALAEMVERQRDLLSRLAISLPPGQSPELLRELAGTIGLTAVQEPAQGQPQERAGQEPDAGEGAGPKKVPKQTRIKSQGPYSRPSEPASGSAGRSASAQGLQDGATPDHAADPEGTTGGDEQ
jgi:hypothetical protein